MAKYVFTKKRKMALNKARRAWTSMSPLKRQKVMPARVLHPAKRYPVGQRLMLDVGKRGGHYIFVKKTKYGWSPAYAPKKLKRAGWTELRKGFVVAPKKYVRDLR